MRLLQVLTLSTPFALAFAAPAWACSPLAPPPPQPVREAGEKFETFAARLNAYAKLLDEERRATEARVLAHEADLWARSETVLVVRVTRRSEIRLKDYAYDTAPLVQLRPLGVLKGRRTTRSFALTHTGATGCGPYGGGDAVTAGAVGDVFVVFVQKGSPNRKSVSDSLGAARARDPRTRAALAQYSGAR